MPFCKNCGNELNPGAKFCKNCGQMVPVPMTSANVPEASGVTKGEKTVSESHKAEPASAPEKRLCVNCGSELNTGAKFCKNCGYVAPVSADSANIPTSEASAGVYPDPGANVHGAARQNSQKINSTAASLPQTESAGFFKRLGKKKLIIIASVLLVCIIGAAGAGIGMGTSDNGIDTSKVSETSKPGKTPTSSSKQGAASMNELISILENNPYVSEKVLGCTAPGYFFELFYENYIQQGSYTDEIEKLYGTSKVFGKVTTEAQLYDFFKTYINAKPADIFDDLIRYAAAKESTSVSQMMSLCNSLGSIHIKRYGEANSKQIAKYYDYYSDLLFEEVSPIYIDMYNWYLDVDQVFTCTGYAELPDGNKSFSIYDGDGFSGSYRYHFYVLRKGGRYYWCPEFITEGLEMFIS